MTSFWVNDVRVAVATFRSCIVCNLLFVLFFERVVCGPGGIPHHFPINALPGVP